MYWTSVTVLQAKVANAKIGFGKAKAHGWVELVKCDNGLQKVARKVCLWWWCVKSVNCKHRRSCTNSLSGHIWQSVVGQWSTMATGLISSGSVYCITHAEQNMLKYCSFDQIFYLWGGGCCAPSTKLGKILNCQSNQSLFVSTLLHFISLKSLEMCLLTDYKLWNL